MMNDEKTDPGTPVSVYLSPVFRIIKLFSLLSSDFVKGNFFKIGKVIVYG